MSTEENNKEKLEYRRPTAVIPYSLTNGIVKSNKLIQAQYKGSALEEKIVYAALYAAQNKTIVETPEGFEVKISANELREMTGVKNSSFYEKLKPAAASLARRVYSVEDPENDRFDYITLLSRCTYEKGEFKIVFNKTQKSLLMNLTSNFTSLPVLMMKIQNVYAFRLYELLKSECYYKKDVPREQRNNVFEITHSISELKLVLGVVDANSPEVRTILESKYPDFDLAVAKAKDSMYENAGNFIRDVIKKAVNEINEKLDIYVEYKTKRFNRQLHEIVFTVDLNKIRNIDPKVKKLNEAELFEFHSIVRELFNSELGYSEIPLISKESGYDLEKIKAAKKALDNSKTVVENKVGFILKAMQENYDTIEDEVEIAEIKPEVYQRACDLLQDEFSEKDINAIIIAAEGDIDKIKNAREIFDMQKKLDNPTGWMISCIKENFDKPKAKNKSSWVNINRNDSNDHDSMIKEKILKNMDNSENEIEPQELLDRWMDKYRSSKESD